MKILCLLLLIFGATITSATAQDVYWGGVGFMGKWKDKEQLYKYSSAMVCKKNSTACANGNIAKMALSIIPSGKFANFNVSKDLIDARAIEGIIMAVGIGREVVGVTKDVTAGKTTFIHVYRISANMMFYEWGSNKLIRSIPVIVQYTDTLDHRATEKERFAVFADLYGNDKRKINVFRKLYEEAKDVNPLNLPSKSIQITNVTASDNVQKKLSTSSDIDAWKEMIAQFLEAYLVKNTRAPLIPSQVGHVLGNKIAMTFETGSRDIVLPEPSFKIGYDVRQFKKFEKVKGVQKTICHAVATTFRVDDAFDENVMNVRFSRTKKSCGVVHADKQLDETFYFQETLLSLINNLTKQFSLPKPDTEFLKTASSKDPHAAKQILLVKKEVFVSDFN